MPVIHVVARDTLLMGPVDELKTIVEVPLALVLDRVLQAVNVSSYCCIFACLFIPFAPVFMGVPE